MTLPEKWGYNNIIVSLSGEAAARRIRQGHGLGWVRVVTALEVTAHHEAAHAAAAHLLLRDTVHQLSIEVDARIVARKGLITGHCMHSKNTETPALSIETPLKIESDRRKALQFCLLLCQTPMSWGNARRYYRLLETHAAGFVDRNWLLIRALADELLKHRTLDREQIATILSKPGLTSSALWTPPIACPASVKVQ